VNLSGTYALASYTVDSTDGGVSSTTVDANDGGTLTLTTTNYSIAWTGTFAGGSSPAGTYLAIDTSATADRGTLTLTNTSPSRVMQGLYSLASDTLRIQLPDTNNGSVDGTEVTVWIKQ